MSALDRLKALEAAATAGPWNDNGENGITQTQHLTRDVWTIPQSLDDVTFIATARNTYKALLAVAEAAQARRSAIGAIKRTTDGPLLEVLWADFHTAETQLDAALADLDAAVPPEGRPMGSDLRGEA